MQVLMNSILQRSLPLMVAAMFSCTGSSYVLNRNSNFRDLGSAVCFLMVVFRSKHCFLTSAAIPIPVCPLSPC